MTTGHAGWGWHMTENIQRIQIVYWKKRKEQQWLLWFQNNRESCGSLTNRHLCLAQAFRDCGPIHHIYTMKWAASYQIKHQTKRQTLFWPTQVSGCNLLSVPRPLPQITSYSSTLHTPQATAVMPQPRTRCQNTPYYYYWGHPVRFIAELEFEPLASLVLVWPYTPLPHGSCSLSFSWQKSSAIISSFTLMFKATGDLSAFDSGHPKSASGKIHLSASRPVCFAWDWR